MNRQFFWVSIFLLAGIFLFCVLCLNDSGYAPALQIVGDVENCLQITELEELGSETKAEIDGKSYPAIPLPEVLELLQPRGSIECLLLMATDGFCAEISGEHLENSYLAYDNITGWFAINPDHPVNANARQLERLVIVCAPDGEHDITVVGEAGDAEYTVGHLYAGITLEYPYPEGTAEKQVDDMMLTSVVTTRRLCVDSAAFGCETACRLLLTGANGSQLLVEQDGYFQLQGNTVDYINAISRQNLADIRRIEIKD